ncbi:FtsQ-type POTRA domain-containing protein [Deinococcus metallilatus]|uniref:Cell division protein FtsQ n=2 Tax=Deinococcus TaxID=1298 RepID=A0AAJ5JZP7_9DEIO|nr:FtsQ-type POTRA domain-containing protein [Deinococcus metallilatus]MBB5295933.1 cell division protein FtsQ [Deinococcus metallilatus]QBY08235.1 FtsQ-type POTRA domain-containing protein [Deinococcus metallilatus]RXJ11966.1 FtsQ-type POTRA domain-containing protein [Deinococcus metallilatus]TLK25802.1 FtsQ-type POTRA domain-containing protein [Deinococcus metallilatus]GMA14532.1 cell division protein FtsQ [Deinococcus metallilatus]
MTDPRPHAGNRRITAVADVPEPVPADPAPPPPDPAPAEDPPRRRVNRRPLWWGLGAAVVIGALAGSWYGLPVRTVTVEGNAQLTAAQVRRLAGLTPGFSWPYYGAWRAQGLASTPWIRSAVVTRRFPDAVDVRVVERVPFARWQRPDGSVVALAEDGTVLPGAGHLDALPLLSGWGPDRLRDALFVARALQQYNVQSVAYTPSGITAQTANGTVWSGDLKNLLKYAGAIVQFPSKQIHIYPWGVSVQE